MLVVAAGGSLNIEELVYTLLLNLPTFPLSGNVGKLKSEIRNGIRLPLWCNVINLSTKL